MLATSLYSRNNPKGIFLIYWGDFMHKKDRVHILSFSREGRIYLEKI